MAMQTQTPAPDIKRGLKDVYFDTTESSFIDGQIGKLLYRGYNIHDLAEKSTFEEVVYLLLYGKLPNRQELNQLDSTLRANREVPPQVLDVIRLVKSGHPMDVLRTAVSALAAFDPEVSDVSSEASLRKGIRLTAQAPTLVAAHHRIRNGQEVVPPNPKLSHAANFLYMLFGKEPTPEDARIMDIDFILHAEHGSNASAFGVRVGASTVADLHAAITAGIGILKGPWHGGAAEAVMKMAEEIGSPERAEEYVRKVTSQGGRIMGFGHRIYKAEDPRARHLRSRVKEMSERRGQPHWFQILSRLEEVMAPYRAKGIYVNVDFYAGAVYHLLGIPDDLFVPIFAIGRIPGWTLQYLEQINNNIIIRPRLLYSGPMDLEYVPIDQRE